MADETRWHGYMNAGAEAYQRGDYAEAVRQTQFALKEAEAFGEEDPRFAQSLNNLAELYQAQGRYDEAEPMFKRALTIGEKTLGHPDVATSLNNLALLYQTQGRYNEAEPMLKRSLAMREKTLGPEHPDVALSLNNLAGLYLDMGRYDEAEPMFKRALAINEKALGPEHPNTRVALENLSALNQAQGPFGFLTRLLREYGLQ
jgi:tetratricopeptide (TPR) repeat protein